MPKRDKQHEEEVPKESTTRYEGGQGSKTREQQQVMRATNTSGRGEKGPQDPHEPKHAGHARLDEDREQHDEAEKNSERNRGDLRRERPDHREDSGPGRGSAGH